jgi:hypothetical protein
VSGGLFDLSGQTAIVTGTSRGLGQYLARALAKAGADLVLTSRNRDHLQAFEAEIKGLGRRAVSLQLDVRNHESIEKMAADAEQAFGHLDILVNNAGCNVRKPALDVTWEDWNQPERQCFCGASGGATHDREALRADHKHWVGHQRCGVRGTRAVWSESRRYPATDDEFGRRLGKVRSYRQLPGSGVVSHGAK